ncbi:hypothetical protein, partial [Acetobacter pomorum]|uniref:hypothetical protein n=1 Tax=Acetobacter pomorum TaxID=65959 RepID=UPI001EE98D63
QPAPRTVAMELETREYTAQAGRIIKAAQSGRLPISCKSLIDLANLSIRVTTNESPALKN